MLVTATGSKLWRFAYRRPIDDNTLNAALCRLGCDKTEITAHGL
ncbi:MULTISPECIES: hypothetical protein [unclassified Bradyrhizobium]|nr:MULTISPECIES: hypothetical protein [unclassified Bradyrhizobium]